MIFMAMMSLTGCDAFQKAQETLDGLLEPVVMEGLVLGVQAPQGTGADDVFEDSGYAAGVSATVFLADAKEVAEIENAPITGATVEIVTGDGSFAVEEVGQGTYARLPDGSLEYESEATWSLVVSRESAGETTESSASLLLPIDHDFADQIPMEHTAGTDITIDFTGLGYDNALLVVLDQDGVVYSNEPQTIKEVYDFTHGNGDLTTETLDGDLFDEQSVYLVGVAGVSNTRADDLSETNTALSTVMMGKMRFYAVSTVVAGG